MRFEDVEVVTGDTRRMPYAVGTFASRAAVMSGSAIHLAAKRAREKALRIAAEALEADDDDLEIVDGVVSVKGAPGSVDRPRHGRGALQPAALRLRRGVEVGHPVRRRRPRQAAGAPRTSEPGLEGNDFYSPERSTFASGMHAVIVETDPQTAEITILKYAVVHDCGHLINPMIVEGQIHGGVAQGVGGALYERMAYDESGQLLNASFMDFLMPYVTEVPDRIEIDHLETPSPLNPLGIKGAGEAGVIPSAAVFAAAIEDAEGFPITAMPISPERAVRAARGAGCCGHGKPANAWFPGCRRHGRHRQPRKCRVGTTRGDPMKITGENTVAAPVEQVWDALLDPSVLVRTIPGCERLEETGEHAYAMTVTAGVAAIKGTYDGTCALSDLHEPASLIMKRPGRRRAGHDRRHGHGQLRRQRRRHDASALRRRRGRRRHDRRRRPADADLRLEADGRRVLRQRRTRDHAAGGRGGSERPSRNRRSPSPGPRSSPRRRARLAASTSSPSSRASRSAPGWSCSAWSPAGSPGDR